jgi:hypothetical protein
VIIKNEKIKRVVLALVFSFVVLPVFAGSVPFEAEDYAQGGEGVAYHDTTIGNQGNAGIRMEEDVDLWQIEGGPVKIGSIAPGEWVRWFYDFPSTGDYQFVFYVGSTEENSLFAAVVNGVRKEIMVPDTGGYNIFQPVSVVFEDVPAGARAIQIKLLQGSFDIDKFTVEQGEQATVAITCTYPEDAEVQPDGFRYYIRYEGEESYPGKPTVIGGTSVTAHVQKNIRFWVVVKAYKGEHEGPGSDPVDFIYNETINNQLVKPKVVTIEAVYE